MMKRGIMRPAIARYRPQHALLRRPRRYRLPAGRQLGGEGIVSKRLGSAYRSGRSKQWVTVKNPAAPAVRREAEDDWR
jgi:hypothetical protein